MSDTFSRVEVITGVARRRRFTSEQKPAIVAETTQPGMSISHVVRHRGLSPSLVFRWRRLTTEGGQEAVRAMASPRPSCRPTGCSPSAWRGVRDGPDLGNLSRGTTM